MALTAKSKTKVCSQPSDKSMGANLKDAGIRPADRKVLDGFLTDVKRNLWGVGEKDQEKALNDLKHHILERYQPHRMEHAMDVAISVVGNPDLLARGIRTLYGYSTGFKGFLLAILFIFGLTTVPMLQGWAILGPWPILGLLVTFLLISIFGTQTGLRWGGLMGLSAASSRFVLLFVLVLGMPEEYTLGTTQALFDFILVSMFLIVVGLLAGHVRETSMKDYFNEEIV